MTLSDAYIHIYWLHPCLYNNLFYYMHICYTYNGGPLWWVIYRIPIGHISATTDWLLIYTIVTMSNVYLPEFLPEGCPSPWVYLWLMGKEAHWPGFPY